MNNEKCILTINGGSSSIKFSLYKIAEPLEKLWYGAIEDIGFSKARFICSHPHSEQKNIISIKASGFTEAGDFLLNWLEKLESFDLIVAVGHRIVHGMKHTEPEIVTSALLNELKNISSYDPDHLPNEIEIIEIFKHRHPLLKQIGCFDTSFHTSMPVVARLLAIPRRYFELGIQRYGFHGLSYSFLMEELQRISGAVKAKGKVILAHLGSGASLAAVKDGMSIDTSMGFSPASGIPMSTRTGDLDPGVAIYLLKTENLSLSAFNHMINHESGLLGVSETSSDMRELMEMEDKNDKAKDAVELFCYQAKKWIGAFAAVLCGLDTLVFSGGIGEHSPEVRSKICDCLLFLGIELDEIKNMNNEAVISTDASKVTVRVISTNEEVMIAKMVNNILSKSIKK